MKHTKQSNPEVARLVERQMRNWELLRGQSRESETQDPVRVSDFICLSRDVGSGGTRLGFDLGKRLGWPVFDKELLQTMAGDDAIRERIYASLDERDLSWLEEVLRSFVEPNFIRNDYMRRLSETVLSLARQGSAVFIGRGADLILPRDMGLRVRIVAPIERRIRNLAERRDVSMDDGRDALRELEEERAQFIARHFRVSERDPERYDLIINLGRIDESDALDLIEAAYKALSAD